jgi:hypothetical protein
MPANETAEAILLVIKRLAKWTGILVLLILAIGVLIFGGIWVYESWAKRPQVVTTLEGISIGDNLNDVFFRLGTFEKEKPSKDSPLSADEEKYSDSVDLDKSTLSFSVRKNIVYSVSYFCKEALDYTSVNAISCSDKGDDVLKRFKGRVRVLCSKKTAGVVDPYDTLLRVYDVVNFGVRYRLYMNKVFGFTIADKAELVTYVGINWVPCE